MPKPIVVGVEPFGEDVAPLNLAAALAHATGAPLVAVAAYEQDPISNAVSGGVIERDLRAEYARGLESLAASSGAELVVAGGSSLAQVLHAVAVREGAA